MNQDKLVRSFLGREHPAAVILSCLPPPVPAPTVMPPNHNWPDYGAAQHDQYLYEAPYRPLIPP